MQLDPTGTNSIVLTQAQQAAPKTPTHFKGNVSQTRLGDVVQEAILALPQIPDTRNLVHGLDQDRQ